MRMYFPDAQVFMCKAYFVYKAAIVIDKALCYVKLFIRFDKHMLCLTARAETRVSDQFRAYRATVNVYEVTACTPDLCREAGWCLYKY